MIRTAVSLHSLGLLCTVSTIFFANASNSAGVEVPGWPSVSEVGLMNETEGRLLARTS